MLLRRTPPLFSFIGPFLTVLLLLAASPQCFAQAPTINTVNPPSGSTAGGTSVTINGLNLSGATSVTFGGTAATTFSVSNPNQITATTPAHAAGTVTVSVTTPGGTANWTAPGFSYVAPAPTVTSVSPGTGSTNGGTSVTITGTDFTGATSVTFGGTAATGITVVNATTITATTPAHALGAITVAVTTPGGTGNKTSAFSYVVPVPTVTSVSPGTGPFSGGTSVTISGTNFTGASSVTFGGTPAMGVVVTSATTITAFTPAGSAGAVNVTVTTPIGNSAASGDGAFTYNAVAPNVALLTATSISDTAATLGGTVSSEGGATITERGVIYAPTSMNNSPLIGGTGVVKITANGSTGAFTVPVSGLSSGTGYSYKAYATNSAGTSYTDGATFTTTGLPTVNLSVSANTGNETAATAITVTATASSAVSGNQTVAIAVSGTGVTSGDYVLASTTITIPDGQTNGSVTFTVTDDTLVESTETATLAISAPSSGIVLGSTTTQAVAITDNDTPASVTITSGNNQNAALSAAFASPLTVIVKNAANIGVQGANVTFTAPGSGASGTFSNGTATITVATDATGAASASFTANTSPGAYNVTATAGTPSATFALTNGAAPTVTSPTSASITATAATLGGNVTSDGGATVTERGVVYAPTATNSDPQIGGAGVVKLTAIGTTGVFTVPVSGLTSSTGYSYKAYATNSVGTSFTTAATFSTPSNNASLSNLVLSVGTLSPTFDTGIFGYTANVTNATSSITVTPTLADGTATITVNGVSVASGSASGTLALNQGINTITVLVTAQDGTTTKTYTVTVNRAMLLPVATTAAADSITTSSAVLHGTSNPNFSSTDVVFEYSTSAALLPTVVSTLAGSTSGHADGAGAAAQFNNPQDVVADASGNLYVAEGSGNRIRKVTPSGVVSTFAGSGVAGNDDGVGTAATLHKPYQLTIDGAGNLYVLDVDFADGTNIRKITPAGVVSTLYQESITIYALEADAAGNLYILTGDQILKRTPGGTISVLVDGISADTLALDAAGYLYINNYTGPFMSFSVSKISPDGQTISTLAGGTQGTADGTGAAAQFLSVRVLAVDAAGNVYVNDAMMGGRYRKITPAGVVTTLAGFADEEGYVDGTGAAAMFAKPHAGAVDVGGNLYIADTNNSRIRKISPPSVTAASGLTGSTAQAVSASLTGLTLGTTYYYRTVAISAAGISYGSIQSFATASAVVETWLAAHFTSAELLDSGISGWTANPDQDGSNNLLEFAFGSDPRNAASGAGGVTYASGAITRRGQPVVRTPNGVDFYADFGRRKDFVAAGVTYTVQFSANLNSWENGAVPPTVVASDSEMEVVTVPFPALLGSGLKPRFFRVLVTPP